MVMEANNHEAAEHDIVEEIDTEHEICIANHFNTRTAIFSRLDILAIILRWLSDHRPYIYHRISMLAVRHFKFDIACCKGYIQSF